MAAIRAGTRPFRAWSRFQVRDRDASGGDIGHSLVEARHAVLQRRCLAAHAFLWSFTGFRNLYGVDGTKVYRSARIRLQLFFRRTDPDRRPRNLVLSGEAGVAGKPDIHLSTLAGQSQRLVAVPVPGGCHRVVGSPVAVAR